MKGKSNNNLFNWLAFYDEMLFDSIRIITFALEASQNKKLSDYERVKKVEELLKDFNESFEDYMEWFTTQYFFRLDYSCDLKTKVENYSEDYFRGSMKMKVWLN